MKNTIKLDNPVQINGKSYNELTYDISEITAQAFAEADARKLSASGSKNGNAAGAAELDYGLHLYLGFAAIIAVNPEIDISDLERVRGYDVMKIMRIGRDFISGKSEEPYTPDSSDAQSETMTAPRPSQSSGPSSAAATASTRNSAPHTPWSRSWPTTSAPARSGSGISTAGSRITSRC